MQQWMLFVSLFIMTIAQAGDTYNALLPLKQLVQYAKEEKNIYRCCAASLKCEKKCMEVYLDRCWDIVDTHELMPEKVPLLFVCMQKKQQCCDAKIEHLRKLEQVSFAIKMQIASKLFQRLVQTPDVHPGLGLEELNTLLNVCNEDLFLN